MPTFITASPVRKDRSFGFTLIELLVVVVIVAIVLSIALLSVSVVSDDRDVQNEGRRFAALYELLQDEAALQGREFGIELTTSAYRFVEYDSINDVWISIPNDETLRLRELPEELEFELYLDDQRVLLSLELATLEAPEELVQIGTAERYAPHLLVFSSGDANPFELHIWRSSDDSRIIVEADALGGIEFPEVDQ